MIPAIKFAECALLPKWNKYTYADMDCQAFVEAVLKDIGVRKPNGQPFNWLGSNSMYRNYYSWHGTIEECIKKYDCVPVGAFVYNWKKDGQPERYNDSLGNFYHVGIYCGEDNVRDSTKTNTRDGVGTRNIKGFKYVSLFAYLDYSVTNSYNASVESILSSIDKIRNELITLEGEINELFRG